MKLDRRAFMSQLLAAPAAHCLPYCLPRSARFTRLLADTQTLTPFSRFTDVAAEAGLTTPMIYGGLESDTYIIESMGGGCAFFDYDNDGWMDIFILGGTRLEGAPAGCNQSPLQK